MMFKKMGLKGKLLAFSAMSALFLSIVGTVGVISLESVINKYNHIATVNLPNSDSLGRMRFNVAKMWGAVLRLELPNQPEAEIKKQDKHYHGYLEDYQKADKSYTDVTFVDGEKAIYDAMNEQWKKFQELGETGLKLATNPTPENQIAYQKLVDGEFNSVRQAHLEKLQDLIDFQNKEAKNWQSQASAIAHFSTQLSLGFTLVGFVLAFVVGFIFARTLSKTLSSIAERLGNGASEIASASQQVASASTELSSSATEQAASLQETASSVEEMSAMVTKNAENSSQSQTISNSGRQTAVEGKRAVEEMTRAVEEIQKSNTEVLTQVEKSNASISEIVKVISEIGNKTKVINDIVFQTKLLSFNASVEAARAGEHGKGFAVVAEEVGNLAQMSGNAAREISTMLDDSVRKVETIVTETKSSVEGIIASAKTKIDSGIVTAKRCNEVLEELVGKVDQINTMSSEVSTASQEQARGIQEITKAMSQLDQVTQQNASASQQAASAAEEMSAQAGNLRDVVSELLRTVQRADSQNIEPVTVTKARELSKRKTEPTHQHSDPKVIPITSAIKTASSGKTASIENFGEKVPAQDDPRFKEI